MQEERGCTEADLLDLGLRLLWMGLKERYDTGHIQLMALRSPARPMGTNRPVVWMTARLQGWP